MKIKVMTFNLRIRTKSDGENIFDNRAPRILDVIRAEAPDVIGFQEASDFMIEELQRNLSDYYFLGHGREADYHGEAPTIAYRWDRFMLHAFQEEMLSLTPLESGSRIEGVGQSNCPRSFACAELICKENSQRFALYNIHTDHKSANAVFAECVMLMQNVGRRGLPFILTGDFNATPDSMAIRMINATGESLGTVDTTAAIESTFHGYGKNTEPFKIDYIFTNLKSDLSTTYIVQNPTSGFYSDHFALCTTVEV